MSPESQDKQTSYDKIPYESHAFSATHPDRLACIGKLFGMEPENITNCKVLELGCARGDNLIPLAFTLPNSTFLGIDLSLRQVLHAQETIKALSLKNIQIQHKNILDVDKSLGKFDYIIVHGIFSWVPKEVQEKIISICSENLTTNGIAYVSYNTYPGWHFRQSIREMMLYHCKDFSDPKQYIQQGRALLDFIAQSVKGDNNPYVLNLKQELENIKKQPDWYIFHDYLEEVNDPIYFHEFINKVEKYKLQYLGETELKSMLTNKLPKNIQETIHRIAPSQVRLEQMMDFLTNRTFRRTLLCHDKLNLNRYLNPAAIKSLYIASNLSPRETQSDLSKPEPLSLINHKKDSIQTSNPFLKAAFMELHKVWPAWLSFDQVFERSLASLNKNMSREDSSEHSAMQTNLLRNLFECYANNLIEVHSYPAPFSVTIEDKPTINKLARVQAARGRNLTNLRHETTACDEISLRLVPYLDGTNKHDDLIPIVEEIISQNPKFKNTDNSEEVLKQVLNKLKSQALLVSSSKPT